MSTWELQDRWGLTPYQALTLRGDLYAVYVLPTSPGWIVIRHRDSGARYQMPARRGGHAHRRRFRGHGTFGLPQRYELGYAAGRAMLAHVLRPAP
jgi:hypothetical protein